MSGRGVRQEITPAEKARRAAWVDAVTNDELRRRTIAEWSNAAHPDIHLAVVADGDARGALSKLAVRWPGRVTLAGPRPLVEVPTWMAPCDVLTLPSWAEGTPNVVLEALASGRRVVATAIGGVPDLLTDATLGELLAARDVSALAGALARASHAEYDPVEIATLGARGGWDDSADRLLRVLHEACGDTARMDPPDETR